LDLIIKFSSLEELLDPSVPSHDMHMKNGSKKSLVWGFKVQLHKEATTKVQTTTSLYLACLRIPRGECSEIGISLAQ
jgi:hypothetical protein